MEIINVGSSRGSFSCCSQVNWLLEIPLKLVLFRTWLTVQTVPLQVSVAEEQVPLVPTELELSIEGSLVLSILAVCETLPTLWSCWTCSRFLCLLKKDFFEANNLQLKIIDVRNWANVLDIKLCSYSKDQLLKYVCRFSDFLLLEKCPVLPWEKRKLSVRTANYSLIIILLTTLKLCNL